MIRSYFQLLDKLAGFRCPDCRVLVPVKAVGEPLKRSSFGLQAESPYKCANCGCSLRVSGNWLSIILKRFLVTMPMFLISAIFGYFFFYQFDFFTLLKSDGTYTVGFIGFVLICIFFVVPGVYLSFRVYRLKRVD